MNSFALITLALVILFLLIPVQLISMIFCIPISLICLSLIKIYPKLGEKKDFNEESFYRTALKIDEEETKDDFFSAEKNNWLLGDNCFTHIVPEYLRNGTVLPVLSNISPQMRECVLMRLATFAQARQDEKQRNRPYVSELADAGFFYEETSSTVQCCRCTSSFELKKMPENREEWHTPWCHFYKPARVETIMPSPDLDAPRTASITHMQETVNTLQNNDIREPGEINSSSQVIDLSQAQVAGSSQLLQRPGLQRPVQPNRLGPPVQPRQPAVTSNNPRNVYKTFEAREKSIAGKEWAVGPNRPHALATNGLYYGGVGDRLRCVSCDFLITGWYEQRRLVDVRSEHAKYSPLCASVRHRPYPE